MNPIRTRTVAGSTFFLATLATLATFGACTSFGSSTNPEEDGGATPSPEGALPDGGVLPPGPVPFDGAVPFTLKVPTEPVVAVRGRTAGTFDVTVEPALKGDVVLEGLPPGVTAKSVAFTVQGVAKMSIEVPAGIRSGTFEVTVRAKQMGTPSTTTAKVKLEVRGAPGEVDETYGATEPAALAAVSMLELPDGSTLVASGNPGTSFDGWIRKFDATGLPDSAFGTQGIATIQGEYPLHLVAHLSKVFAIATGSGSPPNPTKVYSLDVTTGALSVLQSFPSQDVKYVFDATSLTAPSPANGIVLLTGNFPNWTVLAIEATTGAPLAWGQLSRIGGPESEGVSYLPGTAADDVFVRDTSGSTLTHLVVGKSGVVLRSAATAMPAPSRIPMSILRRGPDEFVAEMAFGGNLQTPPHVQLVNMLADMPTEIGPALPVYARYSRTLHETRDGYILKRIDGIAGRRYPNRANQQGGSTARRIRAKRNGYTPGAEPAFDLPHDEERTLSDLWRKLRPANLALSKPRQNECGHSEFRVATFISMRNQGNKGANCA